MKRYTNHSNELRAIHFEDGSTQFLFRGQSFETEAEPTRIEEGIRVKESKQPPRRKTKAAETAE